MSSDSAAGKEIFRNGLAERFGITDLRAVDGIVFATDGENTKKWYTPDGAYRISDQIQAFAKAIMAAGKGGDPIFGQAVELANALAEAAREAQFQREESKGTGNKTELVQKQLTPLSGHVLDWDGADKKVLDGLVELGMTLFPTLKDHEIGDVMKMSDVRGITKLGALRLLEKYRQDGKSLMPAAAVALYRDLESGRILLPKSMFN